MRTHVSFQANFPKERTGDGPPGLPIAEILQEGLAKAGYAADTPENRDDFAWELGCRVGSVRFLALVGLCDDEGGREWLVFSKPAPRFLGGLLGRLDRGEHGEVSRALHGILSADGRFRSVRWYTEHDWNHAPQTNWSEVPG